VVHRFGIREKRLQLFSEQSKPKVVKCFRRFSPRSYPEVTCEEGPSKRSYHPLFEIH
jgi:hypothetical protein